jgi:hypothetical protein
VVVLRDYYRHPLESIGVDYVLACERGEGARELLPTEAEALTSTYWSLCTAHCRFVLLDERRDRRDQALPVRASHQQMDVVAHGELLPGGDAWLR